MAAISESLKYSPAAFSSAAAASSSTSGADACIWGDGLTSTTGPASFCTDFVFTDGGCTYWQCRPLRKGGARNSHVSIPPDQPSRSPQESSITAGVEYHPGDHNSASNARLRGSSDEMKPRCSIRAIMLQPQQNAGCAV